MCICRTAQSAYVSYGRYASIISLTLSERRSAEKRQVRKTESNEHRPPGSPLQLLKGMVSLLRRNFFSIIIDESTDQSTSKQLAILAIFFSIEKFEMEYWLVDMLETDDDCLRNLLKVEGGV